MATTVATLGYEPKAVVAPVTSLSAATTGTGDVADFQHARGSITALVAVTGTVSGGTYAVDVSQDGTNWLSGATSSALGTGVNAATTVTGVYRFARVRVVSNITGGGSITATLMAV